MQAIHDARDARNSGCPLKSELLGGNARHLALKHERTVILENNLPQVERRPKPPLAFKRRADLCLNHGSILFRPCCGHVAAPTLDCASTAEAIELRTLSLFATLRKSSLSYSLLHS